MAMSVFSQILKINSSRCTESVKTHTLSKFESNIVNSIQNISAPSQKTPEKHNREKRHLSLATQVEHAHMIFRARLHSTKLH